MKKRAMRMNFTKKSIGDLDPPERGRLYVYDSKTPGLGIYVTPTGCRTFFRGGRVDGRAERVLIGRFPAVTVEQARREAQKLTGQIAGYDNPQDRRRAARAEPTFEQAFDAYLETHAKEEKRTWRQDAQQFALYLKRPLGSHKLSSITRKDILALKASVGKRGHYAANRAVALVSAVYGWHIKNGLDVKNPCRRVERFPEESRERYLEPAEIGRFLDALDAEPKELWRDFFAVLLLSGARRGNVQSMAWADLNLARGLWTIPASESKSKKAMTIVLVAPVVEILCYRYAGNGHGTWVFPSVGTNQTGHVTDPRGPWKRILARAGLEGVRIHDLRRTLGSWQALSGASLPVIGESLGHTCASATQVYARVKGSPAVRDSVEKATHAMLTVDRNGRLALPSSEA